MTAPTMEQMLDAVIDAAQHDKPATQDYAGKRKAILARFAELERERGAYRALAEQAEATLRTCGCDMNADMIRREIAQRAGETG